MYVACVFSRGTLKLFFHTQLGNHDHDDHTQHESEQLLAPLHAEISPQRSQHPHDLLPQPSFLTMVQSF